MVDSQSKLNEPTASSGGSSNSSLSFRSVTVMETGELIILPLCLSILLSLCLSVYLYYWVGLHIDYNYIYK